MDRPTRERPDDMTPEQWAAFQAWSHGYGDQDENGIDLSLIRSNLKLTPLERIRRAEQHRQSILALNEYGRRHREELAARRIP